MIRSADPVESVLPKSKRPGRTHLPSYRATQLSPTLLDVAPIDRGIANATFTIF